MQCYSQCASLNHLFFLLVSLCKIVWWLPQYVRRSCLLSCLVCSVVVSENQGGSTWGITSDQQDTSSLARKELEDNFCSSHLEDQQMQLQTLFSCFIFFKRYKIKNLDLSCRDKSQHKAGNTMGTLVSSPKPFCLVKHCLFAEGMRREDHSGSHLWEDWFCWHGEFSLQMTSMEMEWEQGMEWEMNLAKNHRSFLLPSGAIQVKREGTKRRKKNERAFSLHRLHCWRSFESCKAEQLVVCSEVPSPETLPGIVSSIYPWLLASA